MATAVEGADARRKEALGKLADFPRSLLLPLIRLARQDLDLILNNLEIATGIERIDEICQGMQPSFQVDEYKRWEVWEQGSGPDEEPVDVGYIFEKEGDTTVLIKTAGSKYFGHAVRIQYMVSGEHNEKYSISPERGVWYSDERRFVGAGDDEVFGIASFMGLLAKVSKSARVSFESHLHKDSKQ